VMRMDDMLLLLIRKRAHMRAARLTTTELGAALGMSQQNASRRLIELEKEGYLRRSDEGIRLEEKAMEEASGLYASLKAVIEPSAIEMEGEVEDGLGEGRYYLSLPGYRGQVRAKLGFDPFPGTLNIRLAKEDLWKRSYVLSQEPVVIAGFTDKDRTYGDLYAYRCQVGGEKGALIVPLRTHHGPQVLEVIAPISLRGKLGLLEGSKTKVRF